MKKKMYTATYSLARHICLSKEKTYSDVWDSWNREFQPPDGVRDILNETGKQLWNAGKEYILRVPEKEYRSAVAYAMKPGIDQEEMYGTQKERV